MKHHDPQKQIGVLEEIRRLRQTQANLILLTSAVTFLIYDINITKTVGYGLTRIDQFHLPLSAIRFCFALSAASLGIYIALKKKKSIFRVCLACGFFTCLFSLAALNFVAPLSGPLSKKLIISTYIPMSAISFLIILFIIRYRIKTKELSAACQMFLILFSIGCATATIISILAIIGQTSIFVPLTLASLTLIPGIGLLCYTCCKNTQLVAMDCAGARIIGTFLIGFGAMNCYWLFHSSQWQQFAQNLAVNKNHYPIFFYIFLVILFSTYHAASLGFSIKNKFKSQANSPTRATLIKSLINVTLDVLFLIFCTYPIIRLAIDRISNTDLNHSANFFKNTQTSLAIGATIFLIRFILISGMLNFHTNKNLEEDINQETLRLLKNGS